MGALVTSPQPRALLPLVGLRHSRPTVSHLRFLRIPDLPRIRESPLYSETTAAPGRGGTPPPPFPASFRIRAERRAEGGRSGGRGGRAPSGEGGARGGRGRGRGGGSADSGRGRGRAEEAAAARERRKEGIGRRSNEWWEDEETEEEAEEEEEEEDEDEGERRIGRLERSERGRNERGSERGRVEWSREGVRQKYLYGPHGPYGGRAPMVGKHKKAKITDEWVISDGRSSLNSPCHLSPSPLPFMSFTLLHSKRIYGKCSSLHLCFLSPPLYLPPPAPVAAVDSRRTTRPVPTPSSHFDLLCPPSMPLSSPPLSAPPTSPRGCSGRSSHNSPCPHTFLALRLTLPSLYAPLVSPLIRPAHQPPWLQWTLVAQLALPPLTLTTAIHEFHNATITATSTAAQLIEYTGALDGAGDTAGALEEATTAGAADSAAGMADAAGRATPDTVSESTKKLVDAAGRATPDAPANPAGVWLSNQKMDEHVQRWLMGRISKRAWSDVAQCVAWYRPDLVFTRHPAFERLFPELFPSALSQSQSQSQSHVLVSNLKQALGLPATATRAAVLAAYEAATWRQQASILRHVARLQLSADWDLLGLSAASTGGYTVTGDGDNRSGDNSDGDSNEDEWGEQDQMEEDEDDRGESGEEGEGRDLETEEGEEEDEDLVWSEAEEQRALARDAEMLKQQGGQGITSQGLLGEGLTGGGDIDVLAGGAAAATAGVAGKSDNDGSISDGGDELSVMERTLVRKKEEAAGEVTAAHCPTSRVALPCLSRRPAGRRIALPCPRAAVLAAAPPCPACASPCPARAEPPCCAPPCCCPPCCVLHCWPTPCCPRATLLAAAPLPAPPCWPPPSPALPTHRPAGRCPALPLHCPALAARRSSLAFDAWPNDLQLYLLSFSRDNVSLFDHTSGASLAPPATADSATRSQWLTRDAAAGLAVRNHLPLAERAHFGQHKTAKALYDAVVARYSSPATAALGRLILPYLFPELSTFAKVEDLITHLRISDTRYRATLQAEFLDQNPPPMYITLYFIVTCLPDSLRAVRDHFLALDPTDLTVDLLEKHLLAAETSVVAVGAARGTPRTPFFEGCSPSPLAPSYASATAVDILGTEDVKAASALSGKRRSSKGKGGKGGGGGSGGGGGGAVEAVEVAEVTVRVVAGVGASVAAMVEAVGVVVAVVAAVGVVATAVVALGVELFGGEVLAVARGSSSSVRARPLRPSCFSALLGTALAEALHTFTLDSSASRCFFRDCTTLTPLPAPVPLRLADPSGGPVLARTSTVLPSPAVPSGSLSGLHLPSFSTNLVSTAALQDAMITTTTPRGHREVAAPCSCRLLSHQTLLWHHRLGHSSLPCLRGMHSRLLDSGLPRSLPPLPPSPAPPCLPCVEGRQRAAPHSSSFPPTTAPLQTLPMDVWGPARVSGQDRERYFLLVVDDYTCYTTVFPLRSNGKVVDVLIPWIRAVRLQLRERFRQDLPVLRLHSDRGGEFSSDLLWDFCHGEGILQSFTLPASPQQNGVAECCAKPRVSLPETSPTQRWTGKVGNASVFRVWGSRAFVRDTSADKLSSHAIPCVFQAGSFTTPSRDVSCPLMTSRLTRWFPFTISSPAALSLSPPPPLFRARGPPSVDPLPPQGPAPLGVSQVDPLPLAELVEVVVDSGAATGAASWGAASGGAEPASGELGGAKPEGAEPGGAESEGAESGGA
ncbi:unnamed protein product [Closterium sp. NIES-54]